jgi:hypothetical protein
MPKTAFALAAALAIALSSPAYAQAPAPDTSSAAQEPLPHVYRLDFSISELQGQKPLASHQYSMTINSGGVSDLKIGTRVPVATNNATRVQFLDVGTSIWCRAEERAGGLVLTVRSDVSDMEMGDSVKNVNQSRVRQVSINGSTVVAPGKPALIGSVDDPGSARQFRLQVTAVRMSLPATSP